MIERPRSCARLCRAIRHWRSNPVGPCGRVPLERAVRDYLAQFGVTAIYITCSCMLGVGRDLARVGPVAAAWWVASRREAEQVLVAIGERHPATVDEATRELLAAGMPSSCSAPRPPCSSSSGGWRSHRTRGCCRNSTANFVAGGWRPVRPASGSCPMPWHRGAFAACSLQLLQAPRCRSSCGPCSRARARAYCARCGGFAARHPGAALCPQACSPASLLSAAGMTARDYAEMGELADQAIVFGGVAPAKSRPSILP
jgi:hypothetical protein